MCSLLPRPEEQLGSAPPSWRHGDTMAELGSGYCHLPGSQPAKLWSICWLCLCYSYNWILGRDPRQWWAVLSHFLGSRAFPNCVTGPFHIIPKSSNCMSASISLIFPIISLCLLSEHDGRRWSGDQTAEPRTWSSCHRAMLEQLRRETNLAKFKSQRRRLAPTGAFSL